MKENEIYSSVRIKCCVILSITIDSFRALGLILQWTVHSYIIVGHYICESFLGIQVDVFWFRLLAFGKHLS